MFNNMKIGKRLSLGFGVVVLLILITAIVALFELADLMGKTDKMSGDIWPKTVIANNIVDQVNLVSRVTRMALIELMHNDVEATKKELARIPEASKAIDEELVKLKKMELDSKEKDHVKNIEDTRAAYRASLSLFMQHMEAGRKDAALKEMTSKMRPLQAPYLAAARS